MKKIVVLMATFNGEKYINQQISSILLQKNVEVKLIIRDDGSTDKTVDICKTWVAKDNRVDLLSGGEPTGTPAGNFYKMLMFLYAGSEKCDFIAFADQDDIWEDIKLYAAIEKIGLDGFAYSSNLIAYVESGKSVWIVNKFGKQTNYDYIFQGASAGCTYVFRYEVLALIVEFLNKVEFEELKYISHDWLVYAVVRSKDRKWIMDQSAYIFYRQHQNNNYGDKKGWSLIASKISMIRNGWYFDNVRKIYNLISGESNVGELKRIINGKNLLRYVDIFLLLKSRRSFRESLVVICFYILNFR